MQYFDQVVNLVFKSLDDPDLRVLCATMNAIKYLTEYKELLTNGRYQKKLLDKLVPFIRSYSCARVQVQNINVARCLTSVSKELLVFAVSIYMFCISYGYHNIEMHVTFCASDASKS